MSKTFPRHQAHRLVVRVKLVRAGGPDYGVDPGDSMNKHVKLDTDASVRSRTATRRVLLLCGALVTSWTLYPLGTPQSEASQIARQRGHHPLVTKLVSKISDVVAAA